MSNITPDLGKRGVALLANDYTVAEAADALGVTRWALSYHLEAYFSDRRKEAQQRRTTERRASRAGAERKHAA